MDLRHTPFGIQAQVEPLGGGNRKHIVAERVAVGKFNRRADQNRQNVWDKGQTLLTENRVRFRRRKLTGYVLDPNHVADAIRSTTRVDPDSSLDGGAGLARQDCNQLPGTNEHYARVA